VTVFSGCGSSIHTLQPEAVVSHRPTACACASAAISIAAIVTAIGRTAVSAALNRKSAKHSLFGAGTPRYATIESKARSATHARLSASGATDYGPGGVPGPCHASLFGGSPASIQSDHACTCRLTSSIWLGGYRPCSTAFKILE
jgi:hypothetical protein